MVQQNSYYFRYPVKAIYWISSLLEWALFESFTQSRINRKAKYAQPALQMEECGLNE